jgi:hypothetical protein
VVRAQTTQTYAYQHNTYAWDAPSGAATIVAWDNTATCDRANDDTKRTVAFPAGFTFTFNGTTYSQVRILTNGILQFSTTNDGFHTDYTPQALPAPASNNAAGGGCPNAAPQNILLPYWIDITTSPYGTVTNAYVRHELLGVAPNRRFVITWDNVALFGSASTRYTFQTVLFEGASPICLAAAPSAAQCANGEFEFRYTVGASNGSGATVGVQINSSDFTQYSFNQAFIDTTNGTALRWYPAPPLAQLPLAAEYRFDDAIWVGTQGEVRDTSGNGQHGVRVGAANTTATQYRVCRAASFPNNTSNSTIDAAALGNPTSSTGYTPGATGSVTFWYRPNANGSAAMLFDATAAANRPFFIMRNASNGISFRLSDSAGTLVTAATGAVTTANTWIHVAVSWKLAAGTNATILQVFINGTLRVVQRGTTNGLLGPVARPAFIGDNRMSGVTPSGGTGNSANGHIDEVRIYNGEISVVQARGDYNATRANCSVLDHFDIVINGMTGTSATSVAVRTCDQATVEITARDIANNPVVIAANAMLSVSTSHGVWSPVTGVSGFTDTGNGGATFTFNNSATASFLFQNTASETASLNINSGGIVESPVADPSLVTTAVGCAAGFNGCEPATPQCTPVASPLSYAALFTKLAGMPFAIEGVVLKSDGTLEPGFSGSVAVDLLANVNTGIALDANNNCPLSQDAVIVLGNANFSSGRATVSGVNVTNAYRDVRMRFTCSTAVCGSAITRCSSDSFAVRPQTFTVTANLGGPALKAGHNFLLSAASGVPAGYTGTPILDPAQVRDHNGAAAGLLGGNFAAATGSSASGTFQYHDVGTIALLANAVTDGSHTAVDQANGDCIVGSAGNTLTAGRYGCMIGSAAAGPFGRFYPDHFSYAATLTPANPGGFSYMNQPALDIDLSLEARSSNGTVTARYTTGYSALGTFSITGDNAGAAVSVARLSPPLPAFTWTNGRYVANSATTAFTRAVVPDGPFDSFALRANILSEPDGVAISGPSLSNATRIRFGRFRLINYHGSELLRARVEYRAEYWDGNRWATNTLDSSNPIVAGNIATGGLTVNGLTALTNGSGFITFNSAAAGSYDIALNLNSAGSDTSCNAVHGGAAANKPWLQGHWSAPANCGGVAVWAQDPSARVRLGSPRAPYIYLRERY